MQRADGSLVHVVPKAALGGEYHGNGRLPSDSTIARYSAIARSSSAKLQSQLSDRRNGYKKRSSFR